MAGRQWVRDFRPGQQVNTLLLLRAKQLHTFRDKPGKYLALILGDRTGEVETRIWENGEAMAARLNVGQVLAVQGTVSLYNGQPQLKVTSLEPVPGPCPEEDFVPCSPRDRAEMQRELAMFVDSVRNPHLRSVLQAFFNDAAFRESFSRAPAAKKHHQAYLGGLLEHSLNVARLADGFARVYPQVDRDLLVSGALLHDIGKVQELVGGLLPDYSDAGRLLGHIVLGVSMLEERLQTLSGFPEQLRLKLLHMLVSHHGEYEFQSPKRPKLVEALLLHRADLTDADVFKFMEVEGEGLVWSKSLGRYVWAVSPGGEDAAQPSPAVLAPVAAGQDGEE